MKSKKWFVPDKNGLIDQVLGTLDPNECALVQFVAGPDNGGYIVEFDRDEQFDADSFEDGINATGLKPLN